MARKQKYPNVWPHGGGWRWEASIDGIRRKGHVVATAEQAAEQLTRLRAVKVPERILTLDQGLALVERDLDTEDAPEGTRRYYRGQFTILRRAWDETTPLYRIGADDLHEFVRLRRAGGAGNGTIKKNLGALRHVFRVAMRAGLLDATPFALFKMPKERQARFGCFMPEQVAGFVGKVRASGTRAAERDADLMELAYYSAMRRAELARLRVGDVTWLPKPWTDAAASLEIAGKTGPRKIFLSPAAAPALERILERAHGDALYRSVDAIGAAFQRCRDRVGEPQLSAHALRHSRATAMVDDGVPAEQLKLFLGHASIKQTIDTYYHGRDAAAKKLAAAAPLPAAS